MRTLTAAVAATLVTSALAYAAQIRRPVRPIGARPQRRSSLTGCVTVTPTERASC